MPKYLATIVVETLVDIEVEADDINGVYKSCEDVFDNSYDVEDEFDWRYETSRMKAIAWAPEEIED